MYERFTDRARKVLQLANQEAKRFNHEYIGTEHILLGLVAEGTGVAANVLKNLDVDLRKIRNEVEKIVQPGPYLDTTMNKLPQTPRAKKVIEYAIESAKSLDHNYVGSEHILMGVLKEEEGVASQVLMNLGLRLEDVRTEILNLLGHNMPEQGETSKEKPKTPALDSYGRDLTTLARAHQLTPAMERREEVQRVIRILLRRVKNCPMLLGYEGSGKIVETLAQLIAADAVPQRLLGKRLVSLDLATMLVHSETRGEFAERVRNCINEARWAKGEIILVFFDLDILLGPAGTKSPIDAAHALKTALARGEIRCIGISTPDKFNECVERDGQLERCFERLAYRAPSVPEVRDLLFTVRDRFETHHGVRILEEALDAAVELADRSETGPGLQASALAIIDDACALIQTRGLAELFDLSFETAEIDRLNQEKEQAVAEQDFGKAANFRDQADKLKQKKVAALQAWREKNQVGAVVDRQIVLEVVGNQTS